ncbi:putative Ribosomal protein S18 [Senna tora]|uniref:Small ribosomal subunit protein bS18c n=1 Tax=Senna tora TaxID=362788 RepID=A0A834WCJ5_9FABA|nr:putative Ribosomal protein S18 [Senna tora]
MAWVGPPLKWWAAPPIEGRSYSRDVDAVTELPHVVVDDELLGAFKLEDRTGNGPNDHQTDNSLEYSKEIENQIFGDSPGGNLENDTIYKTLGFLGKARNRSSSRTEKLNDLDASFDTLTDGMDAELKGAATYFDVDFDETEEENYCYRYDVNYRKSDLTYDIKELDLTKPAAQKLPKFEEFTVTTEEVLRKADFRNVRFLANFLTEAGIIIKRSQVNLRVLLGWGLSNDDEGTGISAKAQRKVAREIKIARAFGLMPFTTMGTKAFVFGNTMENLDWDYTYESYYNPMGDDMES